MVGNQKDEILITLVHGTWSPDATWTEEQSLLRTTIKEKYKDDVEFDHFKWSGGNGVNDRQEASLELAKQLRKNIHKERYIIAHSHGGNVALQALHDKTNEHSGDDLVAGVVCLNTPFLVLLRRDTNHLFTFGIISFLMFLSSAFWLVFFFTKSLTFWPIWPVLIFMAMSLVLNTGGGKTKQWIEKKWLRYQQRFQEPYIKKTPFLCLNSGDDEAFTALSFADAITNLPSIMLSRYGSKAVPTVFAFLIILHKLTEYFQLLDLWFFQQWDNSSFGFLLAFLKLPDLGSVGISYPDSWTFWVHLFEVIALTGLYSAILVMAIVIMSIGLGALSRASIGSWKEPFMPIFIRRFVSLVPVRTDQVIFRQITPLSDHEPLHSSLYNDPNVIQGVVDWINQLRTEREDQ